MNSSVSLWVADPLQKVYPDTRPPRRKSAGVELEGARGEYECFQIGIHTSCPLLIEKVVCSGLTARGSRIPASRVTVRHVEFVPVRYPTAGIPPGDLDRSAPGFFPDPIVHDATRLIPGGQSRSIWGTIHIPPGAKAGRYRGKVTIRTSDGQFTLPVALTVWPFRLPRKSSFT